MVDMRPICTEADHDAAVVGLVEVNNAFEGTTPDKKAGSDG